MAARKQLVRELAAQFERFHATGLKLSHVTAIFTCTSIRCLCGRAGPCRKLRGQNHARPRDDLRLAFASEKRSGSKSGDGVGLSRLDPPDEKELTVRGFFFPERVYGHFLSGAMSLDYVLFVLDQLSATTNEIYFHPAVARGPTIPRVTDAGEGVLRTHQPCSPGTSARPQDRTDQLPRTGQQGMLTILSRISCLGSIGYYLAGLVAARRFFARPPADRPPRLPPVSI